MVLAGPGKVSRLEVRKFRMLVLVFAASALTTPGIRRWNAFRARHWGGAGC